MCASAVETSKGWLPRFVGRLAQGQVALVDFDFVTRNPISPTVARTQPAIEIIKLRTMNPSIELTHPTTSEAKAARVPTAKPTRIIFSQLFILFLSNQVGFQRMPIKSHSRS